jgi:hypothetical protein
MCGPIGNALKFHLCVLPLARKDERNPSCANRIDTIVLLVKQNGLHLQLCKDRSTKAIIKN